MIDRMDEIDGDPKMENDDPAGDPLDMLGEAQTDEAYPLSPVRPLYAVDQRAGPTNELEAWLAHWDAERRG